MLFQDAITARGFWQGFEFAASAHSMSIAAAGSWLGEGILALNAYRQHNEIPDYYKKMGQNCALGTED